MKTLLYTTVILMISFTRPLESIQASPNADHQCSLYQAFINLDLESWYSVMQDMERSYKVTGSKQMLADLVYAEYFYIGYLVTMKENDQAKTLIEKTEQHVAVLEKNNYDASLVQALKGALYAFRIAISPSKAVVLGPTSLYYINSSIQTDPKSPYGIFEKANSEYHMPRIIGGSYSEAAKLYQKAIENFNTKNMNTSCNWYYLNMYVWLAKSYENLNQQDKANKIYQKILSIEPGFEEVKKWIR